MKLDRRALLAAASVSALMAHSAAQAADFSFTGNFTQDDDVQQFNFSVGATSTVTLRSYSYAGGTMADGTVIPAGGFDPILALFDSGGALLDQNDDGTGVPTDPGTGEAFDVKLARSLDPGDYIVAVLQFDNFPDGSNLSDGFVREGEGNFTAADCSASSFCDFTGDSRTPQWAFDILNVAAAVIPGGGGAASTPQNFAGQFGELAVDHHLDRTARRLDTLSLSGLSSSVSSKGDDITPVGLEGVTIRLTGSLFTGDFDSTSSNAGLSYHSSYIALSGEREFALPDTRFKRGMIGVALGYEDISATRTDGLGSFDADAVSYAVYGGVADPNGVFIDGSVFYTDLDYSQTRIGIMSTFNSSPDGDSIGGRVRAGYNFALPERGGAAPSSETLGAYAEWTHRNTTIDDYAEDNGGLITSGFTDVSNDLALGVRYGFDGFGTGRNIFGKVDVAAIKELSDGDFTVNQSTVGGARLTRIVDGGEGLAVRSSVQVGFAARNNWSGAVRVGSLIGDEHETDLELGLELSHSF